MTKTDTISPLDAAKFEVSINTVSLAMKRHQELRLPAFSADQVCAAMRELKKPLAQQRERGGLINPWALAGLKRNEVRTTAALSGLWMNDFGGDVSRRFLAAFLSKAIFNCKFCEASEDCKGCGKFRKLDSERLEKTEKDYREKWMEVLKSDYSVRTEVNPLGERNDRVDVVIQTTARIPTSKYEKLESNGYLIGIEVKIDAGLQDKQLCRYQKSLSTQAKTLNLEPLLLFLSPTDKSACKAGAIWTQWDLIADAARDAGGGKTHDRTFIQQYIAAFGDHVSTL